jgi:protocatechuate 4,5-dioxygenase, beta chain
MAEIVGGIGISHTPSMGMEFDKGMKGAWSPDWLRWFEGTRPVKAWLDDLKPDRLIIVYNDHYNAFSFDAYPTLAIGVADTFPQADESWGLRDVPDLPGDVDMGWAVTNWLVRHEFDLTICQNLEIDHGIYSWMPYLFDRPWPAPILPIAVNMIRTPLPTSQRLWNLGLGLKDAVAALPTNERVVVVSTGGMSHQIVGQRFGMANADLDRHFLAKIAAEPELLLAIPQEEYMRVGGTEACELSMWFSMRAALGPHPREIYAYHTPTKITGCGVIVLEP